MRTILVLLLLAAACDGSVAVEPVTAGASEVEIFNDSATTPLVCEAGGLTVTIPPGHTDGGRLHSLVAPLDVGESIPCTYEGVGTVRIQAAP